MIEEEKADFKLILAQKIFLLQHPELPGIDRDATQQEILDTIFKGDLAPLYQHVSTVLSLALDAAKLSAMQEANAAKLKDLEEKVKDAEENLGETEVRDLLHAKADYLADIGDKEGAVAAYKVTEDKTAGSGLKVDLVFSQIRLFVLYQDWHGVKALIARAKQLCDEGGDWERKNKLKVYESVFALHTRDFKVAANLALDSTATFTTSELFPYTRIILYAVVASLVSLSRPELKKRVVDAPEILTVIDQLPSARDLLHSLYFCKYGDFFKSLVEVVEQLRADMYLAPHVRYYVREIRVVAYSQFLESYKSVTLDSMAAAFGVSAAFLDGEIADLIVAGRLNAKIDKVAGVVETSRPDAKNALYQEALKKGDVLLNRIQKLSRVIDIE